MARRFEEDWESMVPVVFVVCSFRKLGNVSPMLLPDSCKNGVAWRSGKRSCVGKYLQIGCSGDMDSAVKDMSYCCDTQKT